MLKIDPVQCRAFLHIGLYTTEFDAGIIAWSIFQLCYITMWQDRCYGLWECLPGMYAIQFSFIHPYRDGDSRGFWHKKCRTCQPVVSLKSVEWYGIWCDLISLHKTPYNRLFKTYIIYKLVSYTEQAYSPRDTWVQINWSCWKG